MTAHPAATTDPGVWGNNVDAAKYSRAERDRLPKAARRADAEASVNYVVLRLICLKSVLPKDHARPGLDTARRDSGLSRREATLQVVSEAKDNLRLGELIDPIGTIGLGDKESRSKDILGRVYEPSEARQTAQSAARRVSAANQYILTQFASAEGKNGGQSSGARKTANDSPQGERGGVHQFYTPSCVVRCLVEILAPYKGRIYDPACGSGGMFVQSESRSEEETASRRLPEGRAQRVVNFVESLGGISIYGQESNVTTGRLGFHGTQLPLAEAAAASPVWLTPRPNRCAAHPRHAKHDRHQRMPAGRVRVLQPLLPRRPSARHRPPPRLTHRAADGANQSQHNRIPHPRRPAAETAERGVGHE